ncbi:major facilitator superfamily domain-containing protein [Lentinula lateritia]|uniref:Major facilitator superfamily domain-containing protein n=1 Tax=Lentinula lateritia TaxID=40482 RepID=A0ABQ8VIF9_9AGAR|nr:major facilitator superfamily domain-containing protein [Lentinula lateritia]
MGDILVASPDKDIAEVQHNEMQPAFPKFDDMSSLQVGLILLSLGLAMFLFAIEETIVATSVASIGAALNIKSSLTWISTSYFLTTTVVQPIIGRIADVVGSKRLLLIELWIFALGNIIAGTSKTLTQIVVGRLISGIGGAGLMSVVCILVSQLTHERQRATYMNLINAVFIISDAVGPILGGALANSGNWRWIFLINAPFSPVITFLVLRWLRFPSPKVSSTMHIRSLRDVLSKVDLLGMISLVSCLSFLVVALNSGGQTVPWGSSLIVGMLCALGVSGIAFCVVEGRYAKMPIAPGRLFVRWGWRNVPIMMITRTLLFFHNFAMIFYIPIFLQVIGLSTVISSALIIPFLAMAAISSSAVNATASKYGYVRTMCTCGIAIIPIGMGLMSTLNEKSSIGRIVGYSLISGLGFGSATQITMVIAQVGLPADELSTVTALVGAAPTLGGTLGVAVVGTGNCCHFPPDCVSFSVSSYQQRLSTNRTTVRDSFLLHPTRQCQLNNFPQPLRRNFKHIFAGTGESCAQCSYHCVCVCLEKGMLYSCGSGDNAACALCDDAKSRFRFCSKEGRRTT